MIKEYIEQLKNTRGGLFDKLWCSIWYGASPNNYEAFDFQNLTPAQRATYVTNRVSKQMIKAFNDPQYIELFEDKVRFAKRFSKYFGRTWISTEGLKKDDFTEFLKNKKRFIYKPIGNAQGNGIVVYDSTENPDDLFESIAKSNQIAICEEWIVQHPKLNKVYADAINCLRIITAHCAGETFFLAGGITWGNGKSIANASASGIVSPVNFSTGILEKPAADFYGHVYDIHPITGVKMTGFQIPFWEETLQMLMNVAAEVPEVGYVGWDVAITPTGPIIIEGNTTPGYRYYQIPVHMENKAGNREIYEKCLKKRKHER